MEVGAFLLLIAVLLGVGIFLAAPLLRGNPSSSSQEDPEVSSLMAERDRVINALQELDFDYKLGKVPEEDYPAQRTSLLGKGAGILRKLDALSPSRSPARSPLADGQSRIEQAAAAGREDSPRTRLLLEDDKIESMLAGRRAMRRVKSAGFCPRCGKAVLITDQFCPNCGKALT